MTQVTDFPMGIYIIQTLIPNSTRVVDLSGYGMADGTPVILYDNHKGLNQKWTIRQYGSNAGDYVFINTSTGSYLTCTAPQGDGAHPCVCSKQNFGSNNKSQMWNIVREGENVYGIRSAQFPSLSLDVYGAIDKNLTAIQTYPTKSDDSQRNQIWSFTLVNANNA